MTMAAVADPANATPLGSAATPPGEGTDPSATSQGGASDGGAQGTPPSDPPSIPDSVGAAVEAGIAARMEQIQAEADARALTRLRQEGRDAAHEKAAATASEAFSEASRTAAAALKAPITVEVDGQALTFSLTDDQINKAINPFNGYNSKAKEAVTAAVYAELADIADELMPDDATRDAFVEAADGKDPGEWLKALSEVSAPTTTAWKKREADFKAELTLEKAKSFQEGKGTPIGQPDASGDGLTGGNKATIGRSQLAKMSPQAIIELGMSDDERAAAMARD